MDLLRSLALEAIYAAALDSRLWQRAMDQISVASGDIKTHLMHADSSSAVLERLVVSGYAPEFLEAYDRYYGAMNSWAPGFASGPLRQPMHAEEMKPFVELRRTEFYSGWVKPQEDLISGGGIVLERAPGKLLLFGGNMPRKLGEQLDLAWQRDLVLFGAAIRMAIRTNTVLLGLHLDVLLADQALAGKDHAVFLLDQRGALIFANAAGQEMVDRGTLVQLGLASRLRLTDAPADLSLRRVLAERGPGKPVAIPIAQREAHLFRISEETAEALRLPPMTPGRQATLVLTITSSATADLRSPEHLSRELGLSLAEADIALRLSGGLTPTEIAEARGSSIHTVRNQLKSAMSKLDLRRQSDLVARIVRLQRE